MNYIPIETEDGKKIYVSPEDETKIRLASKFNPKNEVFFEREKLPKRSDSDSSGSMYETPVTIKSAPVMAVSIPVSFRTEDNQKKTSNGVRHSIPFYGMKWRSIPEKAPIANEIPEEEGGLNLPPHIQEIRGDDNSGLGKIPPRMIFPLVFRKSKSGEAPTGRSEAVSDPLNEQIPIEINIEDINMVDKKNDSYSKKSPIFGGFPKSNKGRKIGDENASNEATPERRKSKSRMTFKSIFGIDSENKNQEKDESFGEVQQKETEMEDKMLNDIPHADDETVTEFQGRDVDEDAKMEEREIKFPTSMPLRGRWGPKSRKTKVKSAPEMPPLDNDEALKGSVVGDVREGILSSKWRRSKKGRPVSFADEPTVFNIGSDTESADHGSADKSSVSKLTEEKQQKKFFGQLLDSIKRKNKDKVADNEALRNLPVTIDKDIEQQIQKDHIQKDHLKTDGIVYAELDMARSQSHVVRRDDEKTEYAEIIHPKASDFKRSRDELRKSRENLSGSREHLTENDSTTPDGKKEAAV